MSNFLAELKRRNVYRVGAAYAVVAWVLLQLVANVAPILDLPPFVARAILLLLVVGFPVALIFAWMHQLAPESGTSPAATGRLDWFIAAALVVVIALVSYQQLAPVAAPGRPQAGLDARTGPPAPAGAIAIAVLPFSNLSSDPEQEFFSDGMTEEITAALAKIADLRVVARTSAFQFKGENKDLRMVGDALGATHLIEGSVRKAGDRVRITAQLIKADDGTHLWTENYDRQLTDIFVIQEDIAQAISMALRIPLGLEQGDTLVRNRTRELESYDQYLRARTLVRARGTEGPAQAVAILQPVVARDSGFAPAWALLATAYRLGPRVSGRSLDESRQFVQASQEKGIVAAREAIRLDPRNAGGYAALAGIQAQRGNWVEAEDLYQQAFALDPTDPDALFTYGSMQFRTGRLKDALGTMEKVRALEPLVPAYNLRTAEILQANGQSQAAIALLEAMPADFLRNTALARAYAAQGRYADAAEKLVSNADDKGLGDSLADAARILRTAPAKVKAPNALPTWSDDLNFVYLYVGAADRTLEYPERLVELHSMNGPGIGNIWRPELAAVRKTERFKTLLRNARMADYWRERGWPDLCRPNGPNDFACN